ncbi:hypothetical protein M426DRAFT_315894 [Hypoxylon sp. CI-4A]|nr:hypothetical protein M426DRAFT_315894 [Hypoxylon sp. CI-4A]
MPPAQQLAALLAMPASLRLVLIGATSRIRSSPARLFSTSSPYAAKYPNLAAFLIPEFRTTQPSEISPEDLFKAASIPSAPDNPLQDELSSLFTKNPPTYQYGESDFYKLRKNTRVPEVCILGRSNVGKSSFVNALAGRNSSALAYVSSKAGKTRAINTYGFGPAPSQKEIAAQAAEYKGKEDIPTHAFFLVDMPGYGHASLKEWGHNITLYLTKRVGVKGAIVLIDAEVGPKQTDLQLLELLGSAGKKTAIVLTKADKVKGGLTGLRETCAKVWDVILEIEKKQENDWPWEKEIFVTAVGAKDHTVATSTVTTARLAVARLAGLAKDNRPKLEKNKKWSGKVISFDDLQFAPSKNVTTVSQEAMETPTSSKAPIDTRSNDTSKRTNSAFAELERASATQGRHRTRPRAVGSLGARTTVRSHARAFHASTRLRNDGELHISQSQSRSPEELRRILDEFVAELKLRGTPGNHARNMRRKYDAHPPDPPVLREKDSQKYILSLQKRFRKETLRTQGIRDRRLMTAERRAQRRSTREKQEMEELRDALKTDEERFAIPDSETSETAAAAAVEDEFITADALTSMVTPPVSKMAEKKKIKKIKKQIRDNKVKKGIPEEFEAQFSGAVEFTAKEEDGGKAEF